MELCRYKRFTISTNKYFTDYLTKEDAERAAIEFADELDVTKRFGFHIRDYLESNGGIQHVTKNYRTLLDFPYVETFLDPYILGVFLGDGTARDGYITSADKEVVDHLRKYFVPKGLQVKAYDDITYGITRPKDYKGCNFYKKHLREMNVLNNKHIPDVYLYNSRENRLRLLAGLLDTDGSLDKDGNCYDFVQKREKLFDQFLFLCRSLGFACYKTPVLKTCTNSPTQAVGLYYRCAVSGEGLEEIPTLIPRKQARPRKQKKDALVTGIELEKLGVFFNYRIETDTPLYLMEDFTVRHSYIRE